MPRGLWLMLTSREAQNGAHKRTPGDHARRRAALDVLRRGKPLQCSSGVSEATTGRETRQQSRSQVKQQARSLSRFGPAVLKFAVEQSARRSCLNSQTNPAEG